MKRLILSLLFLLTAYFSAFAGGISVDAGLTPAQDRFILRTQYRLMSAAGAMMSSTTQMAPLVIAYGVTPGFSIMAREIYVHRSFSNNQETKSGFSDLFLLSKFRLYRKNTAKYVIGVAPHIASNIPTGSKEVSNRSWDPEVGLNVSFRPRFFSVDVSTSWTFTDINVKTEDSEGDVYALNTAFSAFIPVGRDGEKVLSPVLEFSYSNQFNRKVSVVPDNEVLFISPGISYVHSSLVLEGLVQIPVWQSENQNQMTYNPRLILGLRYMI